MNTIFLVVEKYKWYIVAWFLLNVFQATFTNLHYDEAYYWIYSKILSWGYFDHPPMVSITTKLGDIISHSTLGIRIISILMGTIVLIGILKLIDNKKNNINPFFFIISFPLISSHIAGFLTLPDASLCFFFILFLFAYKKYLLDESKVNVIVLSFTIAFMIYSKYHAFLIIAITILSNINLLYKKSFWLVTFLTLIILSPHIFWQFENSFPSIIYHIDTRTSGFKFTNITEFLFSQIILAGPLIGIFIIYLAITFKPKDIFEKTLKNIALGFYLFLFIYSFRSRIEAHWVSVSTIPLIIISFKQLSNKPKIKNYIKLLIYPTIFLILIGRIVLLGNNFERKLSFKSNFLDMQNWANELDSVSKGHPILFTNKYHDHAVYSFAKNQWKEAAPSYYSRFSQLDFYKTDSVLDGKKVFALSYGNDVKWLSKNNVKHRGSFIEKYYSYTGLKISDIMLKNINSKTYLHFTLENKTNKARLFYKDSKQKLKLHIKINDNEYKHYFFEISEKNKILKNEKIKYKLPINKQYKNKVKINLTLASNSLRILSINKKISLEDVNN